MKLVTPVTASVALLSLVSAVPAFAQARTVLDGVYSEAQVARGKTAYTEHCASCHMESLKGFLDGGQAVPILGDGFVKNWEAATMLELFAKVRDTMPREAADSVDEVTKLDILTYVLSRNEYPAGEAELALDDDQLTGVLFVPKGGLTPPIPGSMARTVGCLEAGPNRSWLLTKSSAPSRTKNPNASTGAAMKAAAVQPLGDGSIRLLDVYPSPEAHVGHRMEAKGLFVNVPTPGINVISLSMLGTDCGN